MTTATIGKWGNAAAIRLPKPFCEQLGLSAGDDVEVFVDGNKRIIIEVPQEKDTLKARMATWEKGRYMTHECDWGQPVGKELF